MNVAELIEMDHLKNDQRAIAEVIGIEAYRKLVSFYGGERIYVSKLSRIISSNRRTLINAMLGKVPDREIIETFGITKRDMDNIRSGL